MKKAIIVTVASVFLSAVFLSCKVNVLRGEGKIGTSTPSVSSFSKVDISVPLTTTIDVRAGATPSLQLNGYENILSHIKTRIEGNTLFIYFDMDETWRLDGDSKLTATITAPMLAGLSIASAGNATIHGLLMGDKFELQQSGATKVTVDNAGTTNFYAEASGASKLEVKAMNVSEFTSNNSGASHVQIDSGAAKNVKFETSGASSIKAYPLQAQFMDIEVSGASSANVTVIQSLKSEISGASTLRYKGHPSIENNVSGASSLVDAN